LYRVFHVSVPTQVGDASAEVRSKGVVAGNNVQLGRVAFFGCVTEMVETILYIVRAYHQSSDAVKTLSVSPPHPCGLLLIGTVEFGVADDDDPVPGGVDDSVTGGTDIVGNDDAVSGPTGGGSKL
jgi:hypothetical protein